MTFVKRAQIKEIDLVDPSDPNASFGIHVFSREDVEKIFLRLFSDDVKHGYFINDIISPEQTGDKWTIELADSGEARFPFKYAEINHKDVLWAVEQQLKLYPEWEDSDVQKILRGNKKIKPVISQFSISKTNPKEWICKVSFAKKVDQNEAQAVGL